MHHPTDHSLYKTDISTICESLGIDPAVEDSRILLLLNKLVKVSKSKLSSQQMTRQEWVDLCRRLRRVDSRSMDKLKAFFPSLELGLMEGSEMIGKLAIEEGLQAPQDWTMGWIWCWKGRRTCIAEDMASPNTFMNFTGHAVLVTAQGEFVSYQYDPRFDHDLDWCNDFYDMVKTKNRTGLKWFAVLGRLVVQETYPIVHAIEAGINIVKFQTLYSPCRIKELLTHPKYIRSCRYSWNININKRHLNCNTFFQAWHVTRDLPFIGKMSDFSTVTAALFPNYPLTTDDYKMVMPHPGSIIHGMNYQKDDKQVEKGGDDVNTSTVTIPIVRRRNQDQYDFPPSRL